MVKLNCELHAGAAQVDITPEIGISLTGYIAREGKSIGVHDPLYATTLVLSDNHKLAAIISCDLVALDEPFVRSTREKIQSATGIPSGNIMIACTHTHSGPATIYLQDCGEVDQNYMAFLQGKIVEGVQNALAGLQPVRVGVAQGTHTQGVIDRRNPGAPIDPEVGVIYICDPERNPVAVMVNYACHPVVLTADNLLISADYPGSVKNAIQQKLGSPVLFLTGAAGNTDPIQRRNFQFARELGEALATEALQLLDSITPSLEIPWNVQSQLINLPLYHAPTISDLNRLVALYNKNRIEAEQEGQQLKAKMEQAMSGWADRILDQLQRGMIMDYVPAEIQVFCLGNAVISGIPGELFSTLGRAIKSGAGKKQVFISSCTNGNVGYIPARDAYAQGGYEIDEAYKYYGYPAAITPEAGEQIVNSALSLIKSC